MQLEHDMNSIVIISSFKNAMKEVLAVIGRISVPITMRVA